jgi:phosphatidylglycerophosphate synthase
VLATAEQRALIWIAARMPPAINSDHLSIVAVTSMVLAGVSFAAYQLTPSSAAAVVAFLALNWFGDSLDGTIARVRGHERPRYGFYVDHVMDLTGAVALLAGIACSGLMTPLVAVALLAAYLLVSAETFLATHSAGVFRISFLGVGPTELRLIVAAGAIRAAVDPYIRLAPFGRHLMFDVGGFVALAGLGTVFAVSALRNTVALYRAEPLPSARMSTP